uniref:HMG box domain-containing protein n=1 Tax=Strigamia maritima TaxID=126957 RepID=T1IZB7_STRMM
MALSPESMSEISSDTVRIISMEDIQAFGRNLTQQEKRKNVDDAHERGQKQQKIGKSSAGKVDGYLKYTNTVALDSEELIVARDEKGSPIRICSGPMCSSSSVLAMRKAMVLAWVPGYVVYNKTVPNVPNIDESVNDGLDLPVREDEFPIIDKSGIEEESEKTSGLESPVQILPMENESLDVNLGDEHMTDNSELIIAESITNVSSREKEKEPSYDAGIIKIESKPNDELDDIDSCRITATTPSYSQPQSVSQAENEKMFWNVISKLLVPETSKNKHCTERNVTPSPVESLPVSHLTDAYESWDIDVDDELLADRTQLIIGEPLPKVGNSEKSSHGAGEIEIEPNYDSDSSTVLMSTPNSRSNSVCLEDFEDIEIEQNDAFDDSDSASTILMSKPNSRSNSVCLGDTDYIEPNDEYDYLNSSSIMRTSTPHLHPHSDIQFENIKIEPIDEFDDLDSSSVIQCNSVNLAEKEKINKQKVYGGKIKRRCRHPYAKKQPWRAAYYEWCREHRLRINAENPGIAYNEVTKRISAAWKALSEEEKFIKKRRITALNLWCRENKQRIAAEYPEMSGAAIDRYMNNTLWRSLPDKEKSFWRRKVKTLLQTKTLENSGTNGQNLPNDDHDDINSSSIMAEKEKVEKLRKQKVPDGKNKAKTGQSLTGFMLWSSQYGRRTVIQNPDLDFSGFSRRLCEVWQALTFWKRKAKRMLVKTVAIAGGENQPKIKPVEEPLRNQPKTTIYPGMVLLSESLNGISRSGRVRKQSKLMELKEGDRNPICSRTRSSTALANSSASGCIPPLRVTNKSLNELKMKFSLKSPIKILSTNHLMNVESCDVDERDEELEADHTLPEKESICNNQESDFLSEVRVTINTRFRELLSRPDNLSTAPESDQSTLNFPHLMHSESPDVLKKSSHDAGTMETELNDEIDFVDSNSITSTQHSQSNLIASRLRTEHSYAINLAAKENVRKPNVSNGKTEEKKAYILWSRNHRPTIVAENPGLNLNGINYLLGKLWRELAEDEKMYWKLQAYHKKLSAKTVVTNSRGKIIRRGNRMKTKHQMSPYCLSLGAAWQALPEKEKMLWKRRSKRLLAKRLVDSGTSAENEPKTQPLNTQPQTIQHSEMGPRVRRTTAFNVWLRKNKAKIIAENPDLSGAAMYRHVCKVWKKLTDEEKMVWQLQAKQLYVKTLVTSETSGENPSAIEPVNTQLPTVYYTVVEQTEPEDKTERKTGRITPFNAWCRDHRPKIVAENPNLKGNLIYKRLSKEWKALPEEEKMFWKLQVRLSTETLVNSETNEEQIQTAQEATSSA